MAVAVAVAADAEITTDSAFDDLEAIDYTIDLSLLFKEVDFEKEVNEEITEEENLEEDLDTINFSVEDTDASKPVSAAEDDTADGEMFITYIDEDGFLIHPSEENPSAASTGVLKTSAITEEDFSQSIRAAKPTNQMVAVPLYTNNYPMKAERLNHAMLKLKQGQYGGFVVKEYHEMYSRIYCSAKIRGVELKTKCCEDNNLPNDCSEWKEDDYLPQGAPELYPVDYVLDKLAERGILNYHQEVIKQNAQSRALIYPGMKDVAAAFPRFIKQGILMGVNYLLESCGFYTGLKVIMDHLKEHSAAYSLLKQAYDAVAKYVENLKADATVALKDVINTFMKIMSTLYTLVHLDDLDQEGVGQNTIKSNLLRVFADPVTFIKQGFEGAVKESADAGNPLENAAGVIDKLRGFYDTITGIFKIECLIDKDCKEKFTDGRTICDNM